MYYLIESQEQLEKLPTTKEAFFQIIPLSPFYHPKLSSISLIYYRGRHGLGQEWDKGYLFCVDHSETFSLKIENIVKFLERHKTKYCLDVKFNSYFLEPYHIFLNDVNFLRLNIEKKSINHLDFNTQVHNNFYNKFHNNYEVEKLIPVSKQYEKYENIFQEIKNDMNDHLGEVSFNYRHIENNGIKIDENLFYKYFSPEYGPFSIKDSKIYTSYNLYNQTTRPTNHFNGINFSALPKESRECFIPENDYFIEFDYSGYHPWLVANLVNYNDFNKEESIYKQLARIYFQKDDEESTKLAKEYTFKQIYGGIDEKYLSHPYFFKINFFIEKIWKKYNNEDLILRDYYRKCPKELNKNQVFNYMIQSEETAKNVHKIFNINDYLSVNKLKTKLIFTNYDSFLFDVVESEKNHLENIYKELTTEFPMKTSIGKNYRDMKKINIYTHINNNNE